MYITERERETDGQTETDRENEREREREREREKRDSAREKTSEFKIPLYNILFKRFIIIMKDLPAK